MLVGLFQRHYKIYKGISFIPLHKESSESLSVIIGNNGCGKSSILEALDTFFNNREFNINLGSKKSEAFVAPLFLIPNDELSVFTATNKKYIKEINDFLWSEPYSTGNYKQLQDFFTYRDEILMPFQDSHTLLTVSKSFDGDQFFFTFTNSIIRNFEDSLLPNYKNKQHQQLQAKLKSIYTYLYIPIETSIQEFLKIETEGMQSLIDKKISAEIDKTLTGKRITRTTGSRTKKLSLIDIINESLGNYIDKTEDKIKTIYDGYDFKMQYRARQNLTANDIKDQIIFTYLSKRTLKKDDKPISNLSAGERKQALIDIAYSFISGSKDRPNDIILAIDEPESSLHISNCYDQFNRIERISESHNCQVILTTHWYGALPVLNKGTLVQIEVEDELPKLTRFNFKNYFEERRSHPNDIQLKSFYDLTSTIISSLKFHSTNWLIVEGLDDYNYLKAHLNIENLKILPVGGCGVVKLLYDFLYVPISHKAEASDMEGKIFCLIDTDVNGPTLQHESNTSNNKLCFRRLQILDGEVSSVKNENQSRIPLEIEEAIDPKDFYEILQSVIYSFGEESEIEAFDEFTVVEGSTHSEIKGDNSMLMFEGLAKDMVAKKRIILEFIENNKENISKAYLQLEEPKKPTWVEKIEQFYEE